ncbi:MAG: exosortase/archaeosortase family protein [Gemmataceae bacterium]
MPSAHQPDRPPPDAAPSPRVATAWLVVLLATFTWAFWPTLVHLVSRWQRDPQNTHGFVVPVFAAFVLWLRRDRFPGFSGSAAWFGVLLLLAAGVARLAGTVFAFEWLEVGSLLPALVGVVWLACGPRAALWAWPAAVLMVFILPWPWQVDQLLTHPLRRLATVCSTFALQTVGVPALARGNIILINDAPPIGVVDACSGLGMLMTFFALSTAVAFAVDRPRLDKVIIFLSAVPIALVMNVLRIAVTVFLFQYASAEVAKVVFHDVAGYVMMLLALVALWLLLRLLDAAWLPPEKSRPVPVSAAMKPGPRPPAASKMSDTRPVHELKPLPRAESTAGTPTSMQEIPDAAH